MLYAHQVVCTPLAISYEIATFEVVALEASAATSVGTLEDGQGGTEEAVHTHHDGGQPGGGRCLSQLLCGFPHTYKRMHGEWYLGRDAIFSMPRGLYRVSASLEQTRFSTYLETCTR